MSTGQIATVRPSIDWKVYDGDDVIVDLSKAAFLTDIAVTESVRGTQVIPHSTTAALDFGSVASAKAAMVWVESGSDVASMGVEVNASANNIFTCTAWGSSGAAGITSIEITNASGADTLTISFVIYE